MKMTWLSWDKMCDSKVEGGLGFRQLKQFNMALLAKQGWRLQTQHESLVYHVYKAKYFPCIDFIHASLGTHPSYTWRSLMATQHLVKKWTRWNVGNGDSIRVWGDKWLASSSTYKVTSPRQFPHVETRVSELISHELATWKNPVIDAIFLPHKAKLIKSIPLTSHLLDDKLVWATTSNDLFTIWSAYMLAMEESHLSNRGTSSDSSMNRRFWKMLWRL